MKYIRFKNWHKYQHYGKKRNAPPWIKLYNSLLRSRSFMALTEAARWHCVGLMLVASQHDNMIPMDVSWIRAEIKAKATIDFTGLIASGMLELCEQDASSDKDTDKEEDEEYIYNRDDCTDLGTLTPEQKLIRDWPQILADAGLPMTAIPDMARAVKNRPGGLDELKGNIEWALGQYGGYDKVRARLLELVKRHASAEIKLYSLNKTLVEPKLMKGDGHGKRISETDYDQVPDWAE